MEVNQQAVIDLVTKLTRLDVRLTEHFEDHKQFQEQTNRRLVALEGRMDVVHDDLVEAKGAAKGAGLVLSVLGALLGFVLGAYDRIKSWF